MRVRSSVYLRVQVERENPVVGPEAWWSDKILQKGFLGRDVHYILVCGDHDLVSGDGGFQRVGFSVSGGKHATILTELLSAQEMIAGIPALSVPGHSRIPLHRNNEFLQGLDAPHHVTHIA